MNHFNTTPDLEPNVGLKEPLLTAKEVAQLLAIPRSTVYEYARRGHQPLPSIEVGRHRRFYSTDISTWRAARRRT